MARMSDAKQERIGLHRLTVRFRDIELEARYRAGRAPGDLRQARVALLVGALVNLGFAPLDYLVLSENLLLALVLRVAIATPVFLAMLGLSFLDFFKTRMEILVGFAIFAFTLLYAAMNAVSDPPDVYLSGFVLVILFLPIFLPVGFVAASAIAWSSTILFAVLIPLTRTIDLGALLTVYAQFLAANFIGLFALYWMERLRRQEFVTMQAIEAERSRHHELLARVLPRSVVARLERGERDIADHFAESTVLFADIVGFTELSARHAPAEIVAFLNRVFGRFDALVERHGVEKIKTIGDAYMVAGGLPTARPDHCEAVAALALDMMAAAALLRAPGDTPLRIRIGIHAGPLIAGVIGESRFVYDLWGDTVNTASRMESLGQANRIQVSEAVYRRLHASYSFEPHGEIEVKGKGVMKTWYLTGRRPAVGD